jgi:DNA-binding beta-propeller fold protein YncE
MSTRTIDGPTGVLRHRLLDRRAFLLKGGLTAAGLALGGATLSAAAPRRVVALIANSLSNTLTLVDGDTLEPFGALPVGHEPHKFRVPPSGRTVYSCNTTSNELIEIDLGTLRPIRRIPMLDPYNVGFTKDGSRLYKLAYRYTFVEIYDARTFHPIKRLETGRRPSHFWFSPDGRWFVNTNQHSHTVTVIDTERMAVAHRLRVDPLPAGVQISADGHYMFVASGGAGTISVFATDEWKLVRKLPSGADAHEMVATGDGRMIFVTNRRENTVSVFEVEPQRVVAKFPVPGGPDMPVLSPGGSRLWVSGRYGDTTTVLDAGTFTRLKTFRTQRSPHGVFLTTT